LGQPALQPLWVFGVELRHVGLVFDLGRMIAGALEGVLADGARQPGSPTDLELRAAPAQQSDGFGLRLDGAQLGLPSLR
jgi:hypothetical protein